MTWIKRQSDTPPHRCQLPKRTTPGDLWACDEFGRVWEMSGHLRNYTPNVPTDTSPQWLPASWWTQRKYAPRYACGCRIDKPQTKWCKNQPHPGQGTMTIHGVPKPLIERLPVVPTGPAPGARPKQFPPPPVGTGE